jgi:glycosyltransferase involved in cell wall biosynthesis
MTIAFIGCAGIPNCYGGFESFAENCAPVIAARGVDVYVTCDSSLYKDKTSYFRSVSRIFIGVRANGKLSIIHDAIAFALVFRRSKCIIFLGVSAGLLFPFFRLLCDLFGKRLIVNVDGVEWRRSKYTALGRAVLKLFDYCAQWSAHRIVYDNKGLYNYLTPHGREKAACIAYPGDHVERLVGARKVVGTALTVCRIEPENNLEILIEGFLKSDLIQYTIIGNWSHSDYARSLRVKYRSNTRLNLLDPIYGENLPNYRESCEFYLHGHEVGGSNPSLIEMLFYEAIIVCYDVNFNRHTAGEHAYYFNNSEDLKNILNVKNNIIRNRKFFRQKYAANAIADSYMKLIEY